jgi:transposase/integrase
VTTRKTQEPARAQDRRRAGGYPGDLTDAQWQVIAVHLPAQRPGRRGRPRIWPLRRIIEAILYLDRAGCAWRYLPADFPPWQTVYGYFAAWRDDGTLARLHSELRTRARAAAGRNLEPTAAVIDSQSVRAADTVPKATRGWDAAKKVNGRKRHIAVDVTGLVPDVVITAASVQDRDAARPLLWNTRRACRHVRLVWAGAGYHAGQLAAWAATLKMTLQIVAKRDPARLRDPAPPLGRRADLRLDQQAPPHRPRLRAPARQPRSHDLVGHDRPHDPPPSPARPIIRRSLSSSAAQMFDQTIKGPRIVPPPVFSAVRPSDEGGPSMLIATPGQDGYLAPANQDLGASRPRHPGRAENWTVAKYLAYWLEHVVRPERKPRTYQGYEGVVHLYLIPELGSKRLAKLAAQDVRVFITRIRAQCLCCKHGVDAARNEPQCRARPGGKCCESRLSVRMVQSIHAVLGNALESAVREAVIPRNVAKLVKVTTPKYTVNRGLTVAQARRVLRAAEGERLYALYVLALCLGLRRGELLGLRWDDIDLDTGTLEVIQTLQRVGGALRLVRPKAEGSARTVPFPPLCIDALREHRRQQFSERADAWPGCLGSGPRSQTTSPS